MFRSLPTAGAFALLLSLPAGAVTFDTLSGAAPLVIAHRGASGYLPEHTLAGYELAIQMGADIVEPDVSMTSDGYLVVMHDSTLDRTTDVEDLYAPRNGGYRVSDFTLAEIKTLTVQPTGTAATEYAGYTPSMANPYAVPTFDEFLDFVSSYNAANGTSIGVYPESKIPATSVQNAAIVQAMADHGFTSASQNSYIQSFDHQAIQEMAGMEAALGMEVPLATLGYQIDLGGVYGLYDYVNGSVSLLSDIATYADGIGAYLGVGTAYELTEGFIDAAHALGLEVHGWTFAEADDALAFDLYATYIGYGIDGIFTNYTAQAVAALDSLQAPAPVPLPAAMPLLLAGLGAAGLLGRRRARRG